MNTASGNGAPRQPPSFMSQSPSAIEPFSVLIARVLASENLDLHRCMAADLNAFVLSLSLLSKRREIIPSDVPLLFERFRLTLQAAPPSERGQSDYVPPRMPDRAGVQGRDAVTKELQDFNG